MAQFVKFAAAVLAALAFLGYAYYRLSIYLNIVLPTSKLKYITANLMLGLIFALVATICIVWLGKNVFK